MCQDDDTIDKLKSHWVPNTHEDTHARTHPKAFICTHSRKTWMIWSSQILFGDPCTSRKKRNLSNLQPQPLSTRLYCWCFFRFSLLVARCCCHESFHHPCAFCHWNNGHNNLETLVFMPLPASEYTHGGTLTDTHTLQYKTNGIEKVWHCWKYKQYFIV